MLIRQDRTEQGRTIVSFPRWETETWKTRVYTIDMSYCTDAPADFKEEGLFSPPGTAWALFTAPVVSTSHWIQPQKFKARLIFRYSSTPYLPESPLITWLSRAVALIQPKEKKNFSPWLAPAGCSCSWWMSDNHYTHKVWCLHFTFFFFQLK